MKKTMLLVLAVAGIMGCGIDKEVYEAKVAELNKTKAELDQTKADAAKAKKKCDETQAKLDGENLAMKQRLIALGQNVSSLQSDKAAQEKLIAEMKKQQEAAEKRAQQFRDM